MNSGYFIDSSGEINPTPAEIRRQCEEIRKRFPRNPELTVSKRNNGIRVFSVHHHETGSFFGCHNRRDRQIKIFRRQ